jgi:hypothetical protein
MVLPQKVSASFSAELLIAGRATSGGKCVNVGDNAKQETKG